MLLWLEPSILRSDFLCVLYEVKMELFCTNMAQICWVEIGSLTAVLLLQIIFLPNSLIWSTSMQRNNLPIPVSSVVGYVCIILVCPSFSSRYSVPLPLQFPHFFNLSNISMPFYTALCPWVQFLSLHSCCVWNTCPCIRFNFVLCRLTARSHITQSPVNPRFLNDRLQWYTLSPGSYVTGGSATGNVSRDGFFRKRNVKMGKVVPETCFKG